MLQQLNSFSSFSSSRSRAPLVWVTLWVIAMHLFLLGIGTFWHPSASISKPRPKVIVQTVRLKPFQSPALQTPTSVPIATPIPASPAPTPVPPPPIESHPPEVAAPSPPAPISPPLPTKAESPPQVKAPKPKPIPKETAKPSPKPVAPVTKTTESMKKSTKAKPKPSEEIEKKRQQEKAEAEKKRQQETAEAERKRQQEIAAAQEVARQKEQALLAKAKETLAKMNETRDKMSSSSPSINLEATVLPKELGSLQVDALPFYEGGGAEEWGTKEISYSDEVAYRLKMALKLPDYGAVKIKLTLDRAGKVIKVETVQSESNKNKAYVESKIPTLLFSSFGQRFPGVQQNTFVITLQNDS